MEKSNKKQGQIYGARAVIEAIRAGRTLDKILLRKGLPTELRQEVADLAQANGIPIQVVPVEKLDTLVRDGNHQGVFAFASQIGYTDLEPLLLSLQDRGETPLLLLLDEISDVRNLGAIARTAECMGAHGIVVPEQGSARINADAMKVSAGALNHLPVCRVKHLVDAVYLLQQYGVRLACLTEKASNTVFEADFTGPVALIFGSEDKGINKRLLKIADDLLRIPIVGEIESLNVSVSVGMALLEVVRQRGK
jgi:23S rRNA (guanosine2251-2'-O)-methyltransferase